MEDKEHICNTSNITHGKDYIALQCRDFDLPATHRVNCQTFLKKDNFHVSLLCVKNLLETKPGAEKEILEHFCSFLKDNEIKLDGFTKEFRLAEHEEKKSIVAMCNVSNLELFPKYLSKRIGIEVPIQPTHVTIYTLQHNKGIGLNSFEELVQKSSQIEVTKEIEDALS